MWNTQHIFPSVQLNKGEVFLCPVLKPMFPSPAGFTSVTMDTERKEYSCCLSACGPHERPGPRGLAAPPCITRGRGPRREPSRRYWAGWSCKDALLYWDATIPLHCIKRYFQTKFYCYLPICSNCTLHSFCWLLHSPPVCALHKINRASEFWTNS
jgi:hypothetical protein